MQLVEQYAKWAGNDIFVIVRNRDGRDQWTVGWIDYRYGEPSTDQIDQGAGPPDVRALLEQAADVAPGWLRARLLELASDPPTPRWHGSPGSAV